MSQRCASSGQIIWSFSFSISTSNEWSGLISFRINWFDLAVQGTLKSLLQHHSSKTSMLRCSVFFQLSHSYMTTGKPIALTIQTFVGKVMSLLFNTLSGFVVALSRFVTLCHSFVKDQNVLISWLLKKGMRKVSR